VQPPVSGPPARGQAPGPSGKKRTGLIVALVVVAALVVAGVVVAVVLLTGSSASLSIESPANGSTVSGGTVGVRVIVSGGVARVDVYLDSEKKKTMRAAPFTTELTSVADGVHEMEARAFDSSGAAAGEATSTFESKGARPPDGGEQGDQSKAYKEKIAPLIKEASDINARIATLANRINTEVNFTTGTVPASLKSEAQAIYARILALASSSSALAAPAGMAGIQSQFDALVEYLRVRTDALMKGLAFVEVGGDYKSQFDIGGSAKTSFDKAWTPFLAACRQQGISI
jgi:hypothetical protein